MSASPWASNLLADCYKHLDTPIDEAAIVRANERMHAVLGSHLIREWKLPERVSEVVRYYQTPEKAPTASGLATATALADSMTQEAMKEQPDYSQLHQHPSLEPLNMYPDELDDILASAESVMEAAESMLL